MNAVDAEVRRLAAEQVARISPEIYLGIQYEQEGAEEFLPAWVRVRLDHKLVSLILRMVSVRESSDLDSVAHRATHQWCGMNDGGAGVTMCGERVVVERLGEANSICFMGYEESTEVIAKTGSFRVIDFLTAAAKGQTFFPAALGPQGFEWSTFQPRIAANA